MAGFFERPDRYASRVLLPLTYEKAVLQESRPILHTAPFHFLSCYISRPHHKHYLLFQTKRHCLAFYLRIVLNPGVAVFYDAATLCTYVAEQDRFTGSTFSLFCTYRERPGYF